VLGAIRKFTGNGKTISGTLCRTDEAKPPLNITALRKPGSRFTRARIVSLKSRVKAMVVTFLPLFAAYGLAIGPAQY
jgi:hypothetical protein